MTSQNVVKRSISKKNPIAYIGIPVRADFYVVLTVYRVPYIIERNLAACLKSAVEDVLHMHKTL